MRQLPNMSNLQFTGDTVYALEEPYEWSQVISINADVMTPPFASVANDKSKILVIEVPDNAAIRYEINPPGRSVVAGDQSRKMFGVDLFPWSVGFSITIVDAANHL